MPAPRARVKPVYAAAHPLCVSFSGIDGAGKSTQIGKLSEWARGQGLTVQVIAFWDRIATLTSLRAASGHALFGGDKGVGSPEKPIHRKDKNVRSGAMSAVRLLLYLLDACAAARAIRRARSSGAGLVIFDRYIYDELANLTLSNPLMRAYVRCIMAWVPRPDLSLILDADPLAARARKPEYPVEFLVLSRNSYLHLAKLLGCIDVISAGSVGEVHRQIVLRAQALAFSLPGPEVVG